MKVELSINELHDLREALKDWTMASLEKMARCSPTMKPMMADKAKCGIELTARIQQCIAEEQLKSPASSSTIMVSQPRGGSA